MMRKEQHKQLQEQKSPLVKSDNSIVNRKHDENSLWDNISHQSPPLSPIGKTVLPPVPTPPRPAVPPGFSNVVQQRLNAIQTSSQQVIMLQCKCNLSVSTQINIIFSRFNTFKNNYIYYWSYIPSDWYQVCNFFDHSICFVGG